jgi:hypothetical protein
VDAVACCVSKSDGDLIFARNIAFEVYLTGYIIVDFALVVSATDLYVMAGQKKIDFIASLAEVRARVRLWPPPYPLDGLG